MDQQGDPQLHGVLRRSILMVFNFGLANTSRDYMEWIGNWYLIYRDAQKMMDLAKQAHLDDHGVSVEAEETGANLYWQVRKSS